MMTYASLGDSKMRQYPSLKDKAKTRGTTNIHELVYKGTMAGRQKLQQHFEQMSPGAQKLLSKMKAKKEAGRRQKKEAATRQHRRAAGL